VRPATRPASSAAAAPATPAPSPAAYRAAREGVEGVPRAERPGELGGRHQAVADRHAVRAKRSRRGARHRAPARVDWNDVHRQRVVALAPGRAAAFAHRVHRVAEQQRHAGRPQVPDPGETAAEIARARQHRPGAPQPVAAPGEVDHRDHPATALHDLVRHGEQERTAAGDHGARPGQHLLRLEQDGRGRETDDAGQRPAGEGDDALGGARGGDDGSRAPPHRAAGPEGVNPQVCAHRPDLMIGDMAHPGAGERLAQALSLRAIRVRRGAGAQAEGRRHRPVDLAARGGCGIHQHRIDALCGRGERRADAGRPAADHQQVGLALHGTASVRTRIPARTGSWQASARRPSTMTTHSWHTPIRQNMPRGVPARGLARRRRTPAANNAAASDSPS
jgi:hypothetical protein